jgi:hypothetical protein
MEVDTMALATLALQNEARAEASRIERARSWRRGGSERVPLRPGLTLIARAKRSTTRRHLAGRMLLIFRVASVDRAGRLIEQRVMGAFAPLEPSGRTRDRITAALDSIDAAAREMVTAAATAWSDEAAAVAVRRARVRESRERAIVELVVRTTPRLVQRGLFDRRADRAMGADAAASTERLRQLRFRVELAAESTPAGRSVDLLLVLTP